MSYKYISHNYRNHTSAGNKAKIDVERIMLHEGFHNIGLKRTENNSVFKHFIYNLAGILKATFSMRKGDILFLQYPLKKYFTYICKVAHICGTKVVVLIHDLGSCRRKALSVKKEVRRLSNADYIIASNKIMAEYLRDIGINRPMGNLELWDYLTTASRNQSHNYSQDFRVAYAGSLNERKNAFLLKWGKIIQNYVVDIYGSGFKINNVERPEKFIDHGFVDAEQFISECPSSYGLVWDGHSIDGCKGNFGSYLALNSPHKISLYLRAGLPIIIWKGAALAHFVKDNGIGITVNNLEEINSRIKDINPQDYELMVRNVNRISAEIALGAYFRQAANTAIKYIEHL